MRGTVEQIFIFIKSAGSDENWTYKKKLQRMATEFVRFKYNSRIEFQLKDGHNEVDLVHDQ